MKTDTIPLWQIEVSNAQKFASTEEQAYEYAHELQQQGRNVEVYENGVLKGRLRSHKQYSLKV
jgi:hypothetical protein